MTRRGSGWSWSDGETSVCTDHPGYDVDVVVTTEPVELMRVFSGIVSYREALRGGTITVSGQRATDYRAATLVRMESVRTRGTRAVGRTRLTAAVARANGMSSTWESV